MEPPALPKLLGALPRSTALAIYLPDIDLALADLQIGIDMLRLVDANIAEKTTGEIFARAIGLRAPARDTPEAQEADDAVYRAWSALLTPSGLASVGIDVGGSAVIVPDLTDGSVVVAFELINRVRFESWLGQVAGGEGRRIEIAGEQASVLEPSSDVPITCLSRQAVAYCQLGAASGEDPIAPLRAIITLAPPQLNAMTSIVRAFQRLPEAARAYAVVNGESAARAWIQVATQRLQRAHRFDPPEAKRAAEQEALAFAQKVRRAAEIVDGAAIGLYPQREAIAVRTEIQVGDRGTRVLRELGAVESSPEAIARWSNTPALARLLVRMRGANAEKVLGMLGLTVPAGSLSGTFALLLLGVDPECPLSKKTEERAGIGWAFMLPSAIAVGLDRASSGDEVRAAITRELTEAGASPVEAVPVPEQTPATTADNADPARARTPAPIIGHAFGSSYEIRVLEDMVVAGTGPGAGAAGMRRFNTLPPPVKIGEELPVVEGSIHLRAIDAALGATDFARDGRRELRILDTVRMRVRPLLDQLEGVSVEVRAKENERRLRVDLSIMR